jgi:SAM-dependent methyltransferase
METHDRWFEDDAFWEYHESTLFPPRRWEAAEAEAAQAVALLGLPAGAAVLDLCCGVGRHALALARNGFRVTGVDRTARYLSRARRSAEAEGLAIDWVQDDMRSFRRAAAFDGAVNLYTSFGYFAEARDDLRVLEQVHASLRPGGRLLIDTQGKEVLARIYQPTEWYETEDGALHLEERLLDPDWGRLHMRWIRIAGGERRDFTLSLRLYAASELGALARQAGFDEIAVYGGLAGQPYDRRAARLALVARKPPIMTA